MADIRRVWNECCSSLLAVTKKLLQLVVLTGLLCAAVQGQPIQQVSWKAVERGTIYETHMISEGVRAGIDPRLLWVVGYMESKFIPRAESKANAYGLMQFIPATAARFGIKNVYDPYQSISGAAKYLSFLSQRYQGNVFSVLAAYNAGEGAVDAFLSGESKTLSSGKVINPNKIKTQYGVPPYRETMNYVVQGTRLLSLMPPFQGKLVLPEEVNQAEKPPDIEVKIMPTRKAVLFAEVVEVVSEKVEQPGNGEQTELVQKSKPKSKSVIFE